MNICIYMYIYICIYMYILRHYPGMLWGALSQTPFIKKDPLMNQSSQELTRKPKRVLLATESSHQRPPLLVQSSKIQQGYFWPPAVHLWWTDKSSQSNPNQKRRESGRVVGQHHIDSYQQPLKSTIFPSEPPTDSGALHQESACLWLRFSQLQKDRKQNDLASEWRGSASICRCLPTCRTKLSALQS